ncbi:MAG: undecaprenyl-diphosphate phosphatase [bacterium]|nr:undecaprenyl-diphosphate phosphatase [bacterium]
MRPILEMIVLGVVQGATEFLPVSSSGHLTILQEFFGIEENRILTDVCLHVGTLIAILVVFGKHIVELFSRNRVWIFYLALATVPAVAVGLTLESHIEKVFQSTSSVGALLIVNGFILLAGNAATARRSAGVSPAFSGRSPDEGAGGDACPTQVTAKNSLLVGAAQALAILPGISRSGSTVCCGLLVGWKRDVAVRFSFLLAIPAIVGGSAYKLWEARSVLSIQGTGTLLLTGLVVAGVVGYVALRLFLKVVERGKLWVFAAYAFFLGAATLIWQVLR